VVSQNKIVSPQKYMYIFMGANSLCHTCDQTQTVSFSSGEITLTNLKFPIYFGQC